jgi:hypothetical protein
MKKEENAFPALHLDAHQGMSLRDYFAAKAMQGITNNITSSHSWEYISEVSYLIADAMLKQREL